MHSANSIFLPVNESKYVAVKGLILPAISFMVAAAIYLISKAYILFASVEEDKSETKGFLTNTLDVSGSFSRIIMIFLLLGPLELKFFNSILITIASCAVMKVWKAPFSSRERELAQIILSGINIFLC